MSNRFPRHLAARVFTAGMVFLAFAAVPASVQAEGPVSLAEAAERGTFNVGPARAAVDRVRDSTVSRDVLKLTYHLPRGTAAGVWAKAFPGGLGPDRADVVYLNVHAADREQARHIAVALEIKGTAGVQRIPLNLLPGPTRAVEKIDWRMVGTLTEVVVLVSPAGDAEPAEGTLTLDVYFDRLSWLGQLGTSLAARLGGVILVSLLAALLAALVRVVFPLGRMKDEGGRMKLSAVGYAHFFILPPSSFILPR